MRRSSSTSHIPLPKSDRVRSKSVVRTSTKDIPGSTSKVRTGSIERLTAPGLKRASSSSNFKKSVAATPTLAASKSYAKKSSGLTPTLGLPAYKRSSNIVTPSSARSRSRSPYKVGSERAVNDKKWVSQQFAKVRKYLQEHTASQHIPDLKPPTINSFVYVMNLLLKEINPHIEINTSNYKDVVPNMLKILHYPGNISNSLLKTVNTMHAWPQVVSIFGWLVDLVNVIKRVDHPVSPSLEEDPRYKKIECVTDYIIERHLRYNNDEDYQDANKALVENFAKILNIDENELKELEEEVTKLSQLKEKQMKAIEEQKSKNDAIAKDIEALQLEIDTFYSNRGEKLENINYEISSMKERRARLIEAIEIKKANIAKLTEAVKNQPCTVEEKKSMLKHIDEMKHTIDLKKEKIKTQKSLKEICDVKLAEAKKKVETEVYRLNNSLMKLALTEPDLKVLQLKETDFLSSQFEKDVLVLIENIKMFENKFNVEIGHTKSLISNMKTEISTLQKDIEFTQKTLQTLIESETSIAHKIEMCHKEMEMVSKKREEQKQIFLQKMNELKSAEVNVIQLQRRLEEVTDMKNKKEAQFEISKAQALEFFARVHDSVMNNLMNMNNVRTEIYDMLANYLKQAAKVQSDISEDLHKLDELQDPFLK